MSSVSALSSHVERAKLFAAICGVSACFVVVAATPPEALAATVTLEADADATIRAGSFSNTNFGALDVLGVKDTPGGNVEFDRKSYVRFDLSGLGPVTSATLSFTIGDNNAQDPAQPHTVGIYALDDSLGDGWLESTITYANAPGENATYTDFSGSTKVGEFSLGSAGGPESVGSTFSLSTPELLSFLQSGQGADGLVTFILVDETGINSTSPFASREGSVAGPSLVVGTPVPVPASLPLLLGGIGLLCLGRRRIA